MGPKDNFNRRSFFAKFPVMNFGQYSIRELMLKDLQNYFRLASDEEVMRYMSDEDMCPNIEQAERSLKFWSKLWYDQYTIFWGIVDNKDDSLIGTIGFNTWSFHNRRGEISYDLDKNYWGQGIMTKILYKVLLFAIEKMHLHRIEARTMIGNDVSRHLLKKMGFKEEGLLRNYRFIRGEFTDICLYSLIPEDFKSIKID